jgi:Putative papain-like cysteine peptidase (DUF1796)
MKYFSIGYRCSSAGILKLLNMKCESYPFDWLISRLPIIQHCIETNFEHFLNKDNYKYMDTQTIFYSDTENKLICPEKIYYNTYYQEQFNEEQIFIPSPLKTPIDTYAYYLALNHRNILLEEDYEYFKRCVDRFYTLIQSLENKKYLYIAPIISVDEYLLNKDKMIHSFQSFHTFLSSLNKQVELFGYYFMVVRTKYEHPITEHIPNIIETICNDKCSIFVLYTNKDFLDAGEIYYEFNLETNYLISFVNSLLN